MNRIVCAVGLCLTVAGCTATIAPYDGSAGHDVFAWLLEHEIN